MNVSGHLVAEAALQKIGQDPEVADTMFEILETERILDGQSRLTFLPKGHELLSQMLASSQKTGAEGQRTGRTDGRHR